MPCDRVHQFDTYKEGPTGPFCQDSQGRPFQSQPRKVQQDSPGREAHHQQARNGGAHRGRCEKYIVTRCSTGHQQGRRRLGAAQISTHGTFALPDDNRSEPNADTKDIQADPELLFHSLRGLESRRKQEIEKSFPDHIMIEHLSIAIQFVYEDFGKRIADLESLLPHKEITYDLLWTIFPPRTLVFTKKTLLEQPQVMTVRETEYVNSQDGVYFHLFCHSIAHDGEDFGTSRQRIRVPVFDGARKIEELPGFPLTFHSQEKAVRSELIDRGRTYVSLLDAKCQEYSGAAAMEVEKFGNNRIQKFNVCMLFSCTLSD